MILKDIYKVGDEFYEGQRVCDELVLESCHVPHDTVYAADVEGIELVGTVRLWWPPLAQVSSMNEAMERFLCGQGCFSDM